MPNHEPLSISGVSFSVGSVYAGDYVVGTNTVGKYPVRIVAFGIGDCTLTKYLRAFDVDDASPGATNAPLDSTDTPLFAAGQFETNIDNAGMVRSMRARLETMKRVNPVSTAQQRNSATAQQRNSATAQRP